jgi:nicotinamidase/pyrazinamidase
MYFVHSGRRITGQMNQNTVENTGNPLFTLTEILVQDGFLGILLSERRTHMQQLKNPIQNGDGLLIVDVQKDFCTGGALAVPDADRILPVVNNWIEMAQMRGVPIYASRDWHPVGHISFKDQGGQWPPHCIQDSEGAQFHPDLKLPSQAVVITKGVRFDKDQNSVFDETGFSEQLERDDVKRLWIGGLAMDVCVLASVLDARNAGLEVIVIQAATRPVDVTDAAEQSIAEMTNAGAEIFP